MIKCREHEYKGRKVDGKPWWAKGNLDKENKKKDPKISADVIMVLKIT